MALLRDITIILIVYLLVLGPVNAGVHTTLEEYLNFDFKERVFIRKENLIGNNKQLEGLPYALCRAANRDSEAKCKIVIQGESSPEEATCEIALKATGTSDSQLWGSPKVIRVGSKNVLVLWAEWPIRDSVDNAELLPGLIKASIVDSKTCHTEEVILKRETNTKYLWDKLEFSSVIPYEDSFDVVLHDDTEKWLKLNVDLKGNVAADLAPWPISTDFQNLVAQFLSVSPYSKSKGYLQFDLDSLHSKYEGVSLIKPDGSRKQLISSLSSKLKATSTVHQTVSIASVNHTSVNVWRFDQEGNSKITKSFDFKSPIINLGIDNLADGGFLLVIVDSVAGLEHYRITKVDVDGTRTEQLEIPGPKERCVPTEDNYFQEWISVDENASSNGYCLSFICSQIPVGWFDMFSRLNLIVRCFGDEDFQ